MRKLSQKQTDPVKSAVTVAAPSNLITKLLRLLGVTIDKVMFSNAVLSVGDITQHHLLLILRLTRILSHNVIM
jgi:hypothetical protein